MLPERPRPTDNDYQLKRVGRDGKERPAVRIMANENMDEWRTSPVVIDETVRADEGVSGEASGGMEEDGNSACKPWFA